MKNIIHPQGYIILKDSEGNKQLLGQIRHGVTFNLFKSAARKVSCVEFKVRNLTDVFYFHEDKPVFHHLCTRDTIPELTEVYLRFFLEEETFSPENFIRYVVREYFCKQLGFQQPQTAPQAVSPLN
jgi:hypothetical protein